MERFRGRRWRPPRIPRGRPTRYGWTVSHPEKFRMGVGTDIGHGAYIQSEEWVFIEDGAQIGGGARVYSVDTIGGTRGRVVIGKNARVGANSVVLPGSTIGEGATVGALSLVKGDIPPGEVWGGVPAKRLVQRQRC